MVHQNVSLHISFLIFYGSLIGRIIGTSSAGSNIVIGYKNTNSGGSSIMQPIRIPENTRNVIHVTLLMNLIEPIQCTLQRTRSSGHRAQRRHLSR